VDLKENEKNDKGDRIEINLTRDEIRDKVKKGLLKQIKNTGTKGKTNRFKNKKNEDLKKKVGDI